MLPIVCNRILSGGLISGGVFLGCIGLARLFSNKWIMPILTISASIDEPRGCYVLTGIGISSPSRNARAVASANTIFIGIIMPLKASIGMKTSVPTK